MYECEVPVYMCEVSVYKCEMPVNKEINTSKIEILNIFISSIIILYHNHIYKVTAQFKKIVSSGGLTS